MLRDEITIECLPDFYIEGTLETKIKVVCASYNDQGKWLELDALGNSDAAKIVDRVHCYSEQDWCEPLPEPRNGYFKYASRRFDSVGLF